MNMLRKTSTRSRAFAPLVVAGVTGATGIGLLLVMLWNAQLLVGLGLTGHVWYVLLLVLGLGAAITVFALFTSYARYTGKVLGGSLEVGGPAIVMLLVVIFGFYLVPPPAQRFDLTVFLHGESGKQAVPVHNNGKLSLDLGPNRQTEAVGDKGEVRFMGIPADMRGRKVGLILDADKYELVDASREILLNREVAYAAVQPKRLRFAGEVSDEKGKPVARARVSIAGNATTTDEDGRFEFMLPADLPEGDRTVTIAAPGHEMWRAQAVPAGGLLQVHLSPVR